jgi:outer membrane murein-binding lipoprotein Lpp
MISGRQNTVSALELLTTDLQALQHKVDALQAKVDAMEARQLDEFDKVRGAVSTAVDDLMARVASLRQQVS